MKSTPNHIIHKQTLDIRFRNFTSLHAWNVDHQGKTAEAVRNSIERCLKEYDAVKGYLTIDRLELDLGVFSAGELPKEMPERLSRELQKILSSWHTGMNDPEEEEITEEATGERKRMPIIKNSEVAAFLFFLQHGYLPWWYPDEPAWDAKWLQNLAEENWHELRTFIEAYQGNAIYDERALSRLIAQFGDGFLVSLLNGWQMKEDVEKAWTWLTRFYEALQKVQEGSSPFKSPLPSLAVLRRHFWKEWIGYAAGRSAIPALAGFFALIKQPLLINYFLLGIAENSEWVESAPECWQDELISLKQEHNHRLGSSMSSQFVDHTESKKFQEPEQANHIAEEDFILIPDAGLVLLHPFLPQLFEYCNWLDKNEFINDEARYRVVYSLHYLAAGNEDAPEYVLMLPKLLCGIPLEWPLEQVLLTDAEKAACDEMLIQVIAHWRALGSTSPAGLRETFLCRQGKLFSRDEGWHLEVQRKTEDVLLNRLPWGFSMIKFSWMPRLLSVSWK